MILKIHLARQARQTSTDKADKNMFFCLFLIKSIQKKLLLQSREYKMVLFYDHGVFTAFSEMNVIFLYFIF